MKEIWKDIPGYKGIYQASNLGRIKSLSRKSKSGKTGYKITNDLILKTSINHRGYERISLHKNSNKKTFAVHQLIAMAFLNHKPCNFRIVVDHINNIKTDNKLKNLQLMSNRENVVKNTEMGSSKYVGVTWDKTAKKRLV